MKLAERNGCGQEQVVLAAVLIQHRSAARNIAAAVCVQYKRHTMVLDMRCKDCGSFARVFHNPFLSGFSRPKQIFQASLLDFAFANFKPKRSSGAQAWVVISHC